MAQRLWAFNLKVQGAYVSTEVNLQAVGISFTSTARDVFPMSPCPWSNGNFMAESRRRHEQPHFLRLSPISPLTYNIPTNSIRWGAIRRMSKAILLSECPSVGERRAILNNAVCIHPMVSPAGGWRFGKSHRLWDGRAHEEQSLLSPDSSRAATPEASLRCRTQRCLKRHRSREPTRPLATAYAESGLPRTHQCCTASVGFVFLTSRMRTDLCRRLSLVIISWPGAPGPMRRYRPPIWCDESLGRSPDKK